MPFSCSRLGVFSRQGNFEGSRNCKSAIGVPATRKSPQLRSEVNGVPWVCPPKRCPLSRVVVT
eukprot:3719840-Karenia_brevis.AAC.1